MKVENQVENGRDTAKKASVYHWLYFMLPFLSLVLLVAVWFWGSSANPKIFPTPIIVIERMVDLCQNELSGHTLLGHMGVSLLRVAVGLGLAIVIGVPLGVLIGWSPSVRATIGALVECIRPIPMLAWIPLMVMWFGIGEKSKIIMIFLAALMPIVVNAYTGIKMVSPLYLDVGKMFNASTERQLLTTVVLPAALPTIFAGIRNATGMAMMVVLAAEMLAARAGLGFLINRGMEVFDVSLVMSGMVAIGVTGALLAVLTNFLERKLCPWNTSLVSD